jgi:hypothetical protein
VADELKPLEDHLVAELDDLAASNEVADYPSSGNKAEKVAALEAAGIGPQPTVVYRLQLRQDYFEGKPHPASESAPVPDDQPTEAVASFMADTKSVTLTGDEVFSTHDRSLFYGLRDLPFLEVVED